MLKAIEYNIREFERTVINTDHREAAPLTSSAQAPPFWSPCLKTCGTNLAAAAAGAAAAATGH